MLWVAAWRVPRPGLLRDPAGALQRWHTRIMLLACEVSVEVIKGQVVTHGLSSSAASVSA